MVAHCSFDNCSFDSGCAELDDALGKTGDAAISGKNGTGQGAGQSITWVGDDGRGQYGEEDGGISDVGPLADVAISACEKGDDGSGNKTLSGGDINDDGRGQSVGGTSDDGRGQSIGGGKGNGNDDGGDAMLAQEGRRKVNWWDASILAEEGDEGQQGVPEAVDGSNSKEEQCCRSDVTSPVIPPRPWHRALSSPVNSGALVVKVVGFLTGSPFSDVHPYWHWSQVARSTPRSFSKFSIAASCHEVA